MNFDRMSLKELCEFHNTFCSVMPHLKPVSPNDVKRKSDLLLRVAQLQALRPSHIAKLENTTPFAVRERLRRAASEGVITHSDNKPWALSPIDYAKVFKSA